MRTNKILKKTSCLLSILFIGSGAFTQNSYFVNGDASANNCHCYTLTPAQLNKSGSLWSRKKVDLTLPFNYSFDIFLGCLDTSGADGIAFVLQTDSTALGKRGEDLGFVDIAPSLGVTIDTYQNFNDSDPPYDHIAIQANGDVYHWTANNLAGPVSALANSDNIEDCKWHRLNITWQPSVHLLAVSMDGVQRLQLNKDIAKLLFNNNPLVYWGFTASTGDSLNLQQVCTALDAKYVLAPHNNTCIGTPLSFTDGSIAFGNIAGWYWDFGDGSANNSKNPLPHTYSAPGSYTVKLNIKDSNNCLSDTFKQIITIGSDPVADFKVDPSVLCANTPVTFSDATTLKVGAENKWFWNFGDGAISYKQNPPAQLYNSGTYQVKFIVETKEGCADSIQKNITVAERPGVKFSTTGSCANVPVVFYAENKDTIAVKQWHWNFDDNSFADSQITMHTYTAGKDYYPQLVAQGNNGCISDTVTGHIKIYATNADAGNDTTVLYNYPFQLHASGGEIYSWSPSAGLSNPFIANPVVTLQADAAYILTASATAGCATKDTIHIKVEKGPALYVPSAFTPNGDGKNDRFKIFPVGITQVRTFKIFNRSGQTIYSSINASEGWDGNLNGIAQPAGAYVWFAVVISFEGKEIRKQGTFVLIR